MKPTKMKRSNKKIKMPVRAVLAAVALIIFNTALLRAAEALPDISKPDDGLEIIRVEAKKITDKGFTLEFAVNDQAVSKNARLTYAYTIYESQVIDNYNIDYPGIIPTTKTVPLNELNKLWAEKDYNVYSVDIEEIMPQTFFIYATLKTPDGEAKLASCELVAEKAIMYDVMYPHNWYAPTPLP